MVFEAFADDWKKMRGYQLVRPQDNAYRIATICNFILPSGERFGDLDVEKITKGHIDAFRFARNAAGLSAVTVNHDLKLLRKMFNWGIVEKRLVASPFKLGTETVIKLEKETPREFRFASDEDEDRVLAVADPLMRAFITTMLDNLLQAGRAAKPAMERYGSGACADYIESGGWWANCEDKNASGAHDSIVGPRCVVVRDEAARPGW